MRGLSVRLAGLGVALLAVGCGGDGGSGGTGPCSPRAATQLVTKSGDGQSWYFNNPLPAQLDTPGVMPQINLSNMSANSIWE